MRKILVVLGDAGSANYILAISGKLQDAFELLFVADPQGVGQDVLHRNGVSFEVHDDVTHIVGDCDLLLCGTAAKAHGLWRKATIAAQQAGVPVAWFGDFFGSGSEEALRDLVPDYISVFDMESKKQYLRFHPSADPGSVTVTGNPAFDHLIPQDAYVARALAREQYHLGEGDTLVSYAMSSILQSRQEWFERALCWANRRNFRICTAPHPADMKQCPDDMEVIVARMRGLVPDLIVANLPLAAVDVVLTDYSTIGVQSAVIGIPTAFLMTPSAQVYQRSRGQEPPFFPILDGDALALGIFDDEHLEADLDRLVSCSYASMRRLQAASDRFGVLTDGRARERVLAFVRACMT